MKKHQQNKKLLPSLKHSPLNKQQTKLYCTFCNGIGHNVTTCKKTNLVNNSDAKQRMSKQKVISNRNSRGKPPLHSFKNGNIIKSGKITSLKKLRTKLSTDTASITALKYSSHHLNISFEEASGDIKAQKKNTKCEKAIRRKKRLQKLKNTIDNNLTEITNLNEKVLSELDRNKKTESWLLNHKNQSSAFVPCKESTFTRHRAQIQRMRVSSSPLSYDGVKERINRLSFTLKDASSRFKEYVAGPISNALRKVSRSLPDARTFTTGDTNTRTIIDTGTKTQDRKKNINNGGNTSPPMR